MRADYPRSEKMKNTLLDLNNHLFAQLERLSDESTTGEALKEEVNRAKAVTSVAKSITDTAALQLEATKFTTDFRNAKLPEQLCVTQKR